MVKKIIIGTPLSFPVLRYSGVVYDSEDIAPIHAYADTCGCIYICVPLNASAETADLCKLNESKNRLFYWYIAAPTSGH